MSNPMRDYLEQRERELEQRISELEAALEAFTFPSYPNQFQSDDGGCTEAIIADADVQRARAALSQEEKP